MGRRKLNSEVSENTMQVKLTSGIEQELIKLAKRPDNRSTIKFLTDQYYQAQSFRIMAENQARSLFQNADEAADEDHPEFIKAQLKNARYQEELNKQYLEVITDNIPLCVWMKKIKGVGPIMSAYIYSRFELTEGRHCGDFISYAGLNDNNVPWLGTAKAHIIIVKIKNEYQKAMESISDIIKDAVGENNFNKVIKGIVTAAKNRDDFSLNLNEIEKEINDVMFKIDRTWYPIDLFELEGDSIIISKYFDSWVQWLVHDDYATSYIYNAVHEETGRKASLIKRGTFNSWNKKKASNRKKYITISDVESFIAKPPYNKDLKMKMWFLSDIFVRNKNRGSKYGELYDDRLQYEMEKNERREYADQAAQLLATKNITKKEVRATLEDGKLIDSHLKKRAKRFASKIFLSHVYEAMYWEKYHTKVPDPFALAYLGHEDYIAPEVDYHECL